MIPDRELGLHAIARGRVAPVPARPVSHTGKFRPAPIALMALMMFATALGLPASGLAQSRPDCPLPPSTVESMRDCYRPLLVFSPGSRDPRFQKQQALLDQYADEMMDRFVLYVPVLADPARFEAPLDAPYAVLSADRNAALRRRFRVASGEFLVVLLGEDGGEKFRTKTPVSVLRLNRLIDSMPTRRRERESNSSPGVPRRGSAAASTTSKEIFRLRIENEF